MQGLSFITILWSSLASGALLLGLVHGMRWLLDRGASANLAFAVVAFSFVGVAFTELGGMQAATPDAWARWVRWCHLPLFGLVAGTVVFVHLYFGTGRRWLLWTAIGTRGAVTALNFLSHPNFNFAEVSSVRRLLFFGEPVTVVGDAVTGNWQWLATLASLALIAYIVDATVAQWRRGGSDDRRRAVVIGGSILLFVLLATSFVQLTIWGFIRLPLLISPPFLVPLLAIAFELSRDMLRASRLAGELRDSQSRLELAAGSARLGLWDFDGHRGHLAASGEARAIFGLAEGDSDDFRNWLEKVDPDDAERLTREIARALDSGEVYATEFRIRPDGATTRWVSIRGRAERRTPDAPAVIRGVLRDVSQQRQAQDETQELRRELAHAGRVSMLGQLSSSLAHELTQPLSAILRNAEAAGMLLDSRSPDHEELKAIVTDIVRDDRRARDVIDRLRAMLKRRETEEQTVHGDSLLQDVAAIVRADAASRSIFLEHLPSPELPAVHGDRVQLSQVLLNLVLNAMDAVAGQPAARRHVLLSSARSADGGVDLCVADTGPGIAADAARRIFEPFYTTKSTGMGLGLSISRTIAEAHGGRLTVETNAQGGATFRLSLPVQGGTAI